jgi:hypothetical protein
LIDRNPLAALGSEQGRMASLSGIALALAEVADSLSKTAATLAVKEEKEWLTAKEAGEYFGLSVEAFRAHERRTGDIPRHHFTDRVVRYHRPELLQWALAR